MLETTIIIAIIAGAVTILSLIVRYTFLSKCDNVSCCWNCIKFHRQTNQEKQDTSTRDIETK